MAGAGQPRPSELRAALLGCTLQTQKYRQSTSRARVEGITESEIAQGCTLEPGPLWAAVQAFGEPLLTHPVDHASADVHTWVVWTDLRIHKPSIPASASCHEPVADLHGHQC